MERASALQVANRLTTGEVRGADGANVSVLVQYGCPSQYLTVKSEVAEAQGSTCGTGEGLAASCCR